MNRCPMTKKISILLFIFLVASVLIPSQSDAAAVSVSISDPTVAEASGTATFTVVITGGGPVLGNAKYKYTTVDGTAEAGSDYVAASDINIQFTNGSVIGDTIQFSITINDESVVESDETFSVTLTALDVGDTVDDSPGVCTITNDDAATLAIDDVTHNEGNTGGTTYTFTVTLTGAVDQAFTVDYATADDSATAVDNDYTAVAATALNFAGTNGETQTFNITVNGDTKVEADERFFVNLSNVLAGGKDVTISDIQGDGTINKDDDFGITVDNPSAAEGTNVTFTITVDAARSMDVDVTYTTADGTATLADSDYTQHVGTLVTIPAGAVNQTQTFTVATTVDAKVEADETFGVTVTSADGNFDGNNASGTGTINNNDYTVVFTASANGSLTGSTTQMVNHGSDCTPVTAVPDAGHHFTAWSGDDTSSDNPLTITNVTSDMNIQANFPINECCVRVNQTINGGQWNLLGTFDFASGTGAHVTITREADNDYTSADAIWFSKTDGSSGVTIDNKDAEYSETGTWGDGTDLSYLPWDHINDPGATYRYSTDEATPATATWTPNLPSAGEYKVYAWWAALSSRPYHAPYCIRGHTTGDLGTYYTIHSTAGSNGTISPSGYVSVVEGSNQTFNITPDATYFVDRLNVDGSYQGAYEDSQATTYTFNNVNDTHTISVTFDDNVDTCGHANTNAVSCNSAVSGYIERNGDYDYFKFVLANTKVVSIYSTGSMDTYGYLYDAGCTQLTSNNDSGESSNFLMIQELAPGTYYIRVNENGNNATGSYTLHVDCAHQIISSASSEGAISPSGETFVPHGTDITFTITPTVCYTVTDVTVDGALQGIGALVDGAGVSTYTFTNVSANHTIDATSYDIKRYDIDASAGPNGAIDPSGVTSATCGSQPTYYMNPSEGYHVAHVMVNGSSVGGVGVYTFDPVENAQSIYAVFDWGESNESCVNVNQQQNAGQWNLLGTYNFVKGKGAFVTITREDGDGNSTCADAVRFVRTSDGTEIIVDNADADYTETGNWTDSSAQNSYPSGVASRFSDDGGAIATWTPDLPSSDTYDVYAWWTTAGTRAQHAPYCIYGLSGKIVTATAGIHGYIISSGTTVGPDASHAFTFDSGSNAVFTISAASGYVIHDVVVDGLSAVNNCVPPATGATATTYTFTNISASHSIEATFEDHSDTCANATPVTCNGVYDGKISPEDDWDYFKLETGGGVYTIWTEGEDDTYGYLLDTSCVTDSPIAEDDNSGPNERFEIADVELTAGTYYIAVRQDNDGSLNPDLDYTLHLTCQHIIRASAQSGGDIDPGGDNIVNHGANIIFTITADPGNSVADVLVDGLSMGGVTTYTFTNVTANHTIIAQFTMPPGLCNDISDQPLDTIQTGAPANIVFVIDDSGSMDWEIMTSESDGKFENYEYIFDDPGDHVYKTGTNSQILEEDEEDRKLWKSQWCVINKMYYNPKMYYIPWPTLTDADPDNPRSHPTESTPTFDINATFDTVGQAYIVENEGTFDANDIFVPSGGTRFVVTGTWRRSSVSYWHGPDPARSIYSNDLGATATWTTALPAAGDYEVLAWWTATDGRARHVNYTIHAAGGDEIKANQNHQNNGGQWNSLGTYNFGTTGSVTVPREDDQDHTCADAIAFVPTVGATTIDIKRAHYYTWADLDGDNALDSGETVYFVNLNSGTSTIQYYVLDVSDDMIEAGDLTPIAEADVAVEARPKNQDGSFRTYAEDKQNFANWFSFYRRRELAATNAIANVIVQMQGVNIGYRSINGYLIQPVLPVHVGTEDETNALLNKLYSYGIVVQQASTPLRAGLRETGRYFDKDDGDDGGVGDSPIASAEDGGECQQNFAIMFTDGHYNGGAPGFANIDGDNGVPYADDQPNTLADVAMYYYENDLADNLENDVPPNPADDATHQHMVTYAVSFGVTGSMDPDDYDLDTGPYPEWPNPALNDTYKIDDMWHSAINGRGLFLNASNPMELIDALVKIMENIVARTGSASSVSINGEELYGTLGENIRMFQANYSSGTKTGDIKSYTIDAVTGGVSEVPLWSAATMLDDFIDLHGHTNRVIATYSGVSNAGIPFRYANLLASGTTQQQEYLRPDFGDPVIATTENLINYLRGDDTNEQENDGPFRDRESKMGDIVHSSPLYFNGVLYAGGNDGMLHAVSAEDGHEIFAYVPGLVYENLKDFANPRYHHYYFVDLTPFAADMDGESLLIGGLGKGGRGYYCLDISGVSSATTLTETELVNVVKWEYPRSGTTTADIDDMGYSFSKAILVKSNDPDVNSDGERWIVVFGNGYNSENSHAVLFIVDPTDGTLIKKIDTGAGNCNGLSTPLLIDTDSDEKVDYVYAGDLKGNMWKFDLTSADYNNWDVAYYESSGVTPQPVFQAKGPAGLPQPITTKPDAMFHCEREGFLVLFGTGKYMGMIDLMDTSTQTIYGIWDYGDDDDDTEYLGSFNRVSAQKLSNQPLYDVTLLEQTTAFEGYVDIDANGLDEDDPYLRVLSNEPAYWDVTLEDSGTTPCACGDCPTGDECDPNSVGAYPDPVYHAGWYYDLPLSGEKLVSDPMIRLGNAVLVPFVPSDSPCTVGGDTIVLEMDACSGARLCRPQFDINGDGVIDDNDLISIPDPDNPGQTIMVAPTGKRYEGRLQPPVILRLHRADKEIKYFSSSGGKIEIMTEKAAPLGLIYWREFD